MGTNEAQQKAQRQIIGLDLIRAAAALLVMLFHLGYWEWTKSADPRAVMPAAYVPLAPVLSAGWIGVEIFFVISGFVIAYSTEGATAARFFRHRVNRLLPTAVVCATITGLVLLTAYPLRVVSLQWLRSITFYPEGPWIDGTYWTLPIEVSFYALMFATLLVRKGRHLLAVMGVLGTVSASVCILCAFPALYSPAWFVRLTAPLSFPPSACLLLVHGCFFALGVFLFQALVHRATLGATCMLAVCGSGCVAEILYHERNLASLADGAPYHALPMTLWLCCVAGLIFAVKGKDRLREYLGARGALVARQIGVATYPLYLLHDKVGQVTIAVLRKRVGYSYALVCASILILGSAVLISQVLEPPLQSLLRSFWRWLDNRAGPKNGLKLLVADGPHESTTESSRTG